MERLSKEVMKAKYSSIFLFLFTLFTFADSTIEEQKIQFLLKEINSSKAVFLRNGSEHTAIEASEHLEGKMNRAKSMFWFFGPKKKFSCQEFIDKIASKSSTSGEDYKMKLSDGKIITTKEWLEEKLKSFKAPNENTK